MKKSLKKLLASAVTLASLFAVMLPVTAFAAPGDVASVDGTPYSSLQTAIDNADGKTVMLLDNVNESITIASSQTVTLNLNGFNLTNTAGKHTITNAGTLTVEGNGTVDNVSHGKGALVNTGIVTLNGGTFTRSQEKGTAAGANGNSWYVVDNHGTITVNNGVTITNTSGFSSLIRNGNPAGTLNVFGGVFSNDFIVLKNDDNGTITMTGGTVSTTGAGGSALQNWGQATVSGGTLNAVDSAVAVYALTWDDAYTSDLTITGSATLNGDVKVMRDDYETSNNPTVVVAGGMVDGNIIADLQADVSVTGGTVTGSVTATASAVSLDISGGSFAQAPNTDYIVDGQAAAGVDGTYYVGTPEAIQEKANTATTSVEVLTGDMELNLPNGVKVTNAGDGKVIVNGSTVEKDGTIVTHVHSAVKVEAKEATATEAGNIEYWYCEGCGKYFSDEALTKEISKDATIIPAKTVTSDLPVTGESNMLFVIVGLFAVAGGVLGIRFYGKNSSHWRKYN